MQPRRWSHQDHAEDHAGDHAEAFEQHRRHRHDVDRDRLEAPRQPRQPAGHAEQRGGCAQPAMVGADGGPSDVLVCARQGERHESADCFV
jgi:hypothetical protein